MIFGLDLSSLWGFEEDGIFLVLMISYFSYDFMCYTWQKNNILTINQLYLISYAIPNKSTIIWQTPKLNLISYTILDKITAIWQIYNTSGTYNSIVLKVWELWLAIKFIATIEFVVHPTFWFHRIWFRSFGWLYDLEEYNDLLDHTNKIKVLSDLLACLKIHVRNKDTVITLLKSLSPLYEH